MLAIEDGIICAIRRSGLRRGSHHIEASESVVLPAFSNAHTHGFEFAFKGYKQGRRLEDPHPQWFWEIYDSAPPSLLIGGFVAHLAECLMAGVGYVGEVTRRDCPVNVFEHVMFDVGIKGRIFGVHGEVRGFDLGSEAEETLEVRLTEAKRLSRTVPIHMHFLETENRKSLVLHRFHMTSIELLERFELQDRRLVLSHGGATSADDISRMSAWKQVLFVATPTAEAQLGELTVDASTLRSFGIPLALGTDGPAYNPATDMFAEMRALGRSAHWGPAEALYAATLCPRSWLGGTSMGLYEGAPADFLILSLKHSRLRPVVRQPYDNLLQLLVTAATASDVTHTVVGGRVLYEAGRLTTINLRSVLTELERDLTMYYADLGLRSKHEFTL